MAKPSTSGAEARAGTEDAESAVASVKLCGCGEGGGGGGDGGGGEPGISILACREGQSTFFSAVTIRGYDPSRHQQARAATDRLIVRKAIYRSDACLGMRVG